MASSYQVIIRASLDPTGLKSGSRQAQTAFEQMAHKAAESAKKQVDAYQKMHKQIEQGRQSFVRDQIAAAERAAAGTIGATARTAREIQKIDQAALRTRNKQMQDALRDISKMEKDRAKIMAQNERAISAAAKAENQQRTREFKRSLSQMLSDLKQGAQETGITFSKLLGASFLGNLAARGFTAFVAAARRAFSEAIQYVRDFVTEAIDLSSQAQNAFAGLASIAKFQGLDQSSTEEAVRNLRFVRGGIISIADASLSLRNLLSTGLGLKESVDILERFSDAASFGKQAALDYGQAIRSASEGIKNQNSILVDNVGITKNLSVILKERGFIMEDLTSKVKGAAAREALYQGLLEESAAQVGDADKIMQLYTGTIAAQDTAYQNLQRAIGDIIVMHPALIESNKIVTEQINAGTDAIKAQDSATAKFVDNSIRAWATIKAHALPFIVFMISGIAAVGAAWKGIVTGTMGAIVRVTELAVDAVKAGLAAIVNAFGSATNAMLGAARLIPGSSVLGIPNIPTWSPGPTNLGGRGLLSGAASSFGQSGQFFAAMQSAGREGAAIRRQMAGADTNAEAARRVDAAIQFGQTTQSLAEAVAGRRRAGGAAEIDTEGGGRGGRGRGARDEDFADYWRKRAEQFRRARELQPLETTTGPLAQLPLQLERQWEKYYEKIEQSEKDLRDRRTDFGLEYLADQKALTTEIGNLELDLAKFRQQSDDAQFHQQTRVVAVMHEQLALETNIRDLEIEIANSPYNAHLRAQVQMLEEKFDLERSIEIVQNEIANGPYNESLRIQLALLEDIADVRRRDEHAIIAQNRAQIELAEAEVFHGQQARAIVLEHLSRTRSQTEIFADAIIDSYQAVNDVVFQGVQKITGGIKILDNLIAGLISRLANRLFQKLLDVLIPPTGGQQQGGGFFGLPNIAQTIFGRGFAGGSGASGLPGSQLSLAGILGAIPAGTITAPPSLSGAAASQGALGQILAQAGGGAAGGAAGALGGAGGFGAMLGPLLPFLGAGIGSSLGGGSRFGSILGGAGGLLAGGIGAAFLTPGLFAAGGALGSLGPVLGAFLTSPAALVAAPLLILGAILLGRASTRRREEAERDRLREEAYAQLTQLLELARRGQLDPATAGIQAQSIVDQYYQQIAQFRTGSVRRSAENFRPFFNSQVQKIVEAAKGAQRRQEIASKIIPEFQHGGLVPFRSNALTLIKVRPQEKLFFPSGMSARVPGIDRGVDSVYTYAPAGTSVVPPNVPSFANGGTVGAAPGTVEVTINLKQDMKEIVVESIKTSDGRKAVVRAVRLGGLDGQFN